RPYPLLQCRDRARAVADSDLRHPVERDASSGCARVVEAGAHAPTVWVHDRWWLAELRVDRARRRSLRSARAFLSALRRPTPTEHGTIRAGTCDPPRRSTRSR